MPGAPFAQPNQQNRALARPVIPAQVWWLGLVSFFTDVSSEMIFAVLPIFLVGVLGASTVTLGAIEGLADFSASSLDLVSGYLADRKGWKKGLAVGGYGFSSLAKVFLVWAATANQVLAFRVIERLGKSVRGAPRDALIAGASAGEHRGLAFGVHKAFDKAGAVMGPLIAYGLLSWRGQTAPTFHLLFIVALFPAALAVAILAAAVRPVPGAAKSRPAVGEVLKRAGRPFRRYLISAGLFSVGYLSFAFLLLRADQVGFPPSQVALLYALYNGSFTVLSAPLGRLGDRIGRRLIIGGSYVLYAATMIGFATVSSKPAVVALFIAYGAFYAIDEGQTKAFISDLVEPGARATGIGIYGLITGALYFPASLVGGFLWARWGAGPAFAFAAAVAVAALFVFATAGRAAQPESGAAAA